MGRIARFLGQSLIAEAASGEAAAANMPLSFWGGFDPETGIIIDRRHQLAGLTITGQVLTIPSGRGSCSGSGVILEAIYNGTAPAAILTSRPDPIIVLGVVLADELYGKRLPVVILAPEDLQEIVTGDFVSIDHDGWVIVERGRT
jgi:predicted aconitase with swiveling domain